MQIRAAPLARNTFNSEKRTVEVTFTTGAGVRRRDWRNDVDYLETLSCEKGAVRLDRLNSGAPVLDTHAKYRLADQVGVVLEATVDGKQGVATLQLSERDEVAGLVKDIAAGVVRNVSVGYVIHRIEKIPPANDDQIWEYRVVDWEPLEISFVPVGADPAAGVRTDDQKVYPVQIQEHSMTVKATTQSQGTDQAVLAERARVDEVFALGNKAGMPAEFTQRMVSDGISVDQAKDRIFDFLVREDDRTSNRTQNVRAHLLSGDVDVDGERSMDLMIQVIASRQGVKIDDPDAHQYRGMSLPEMIRTQLEMRGVRTTGMTRTEIVDTALGYGRGQITTSDLPELLAGVGNRLLRNRFQEEPSALKAIFRASTVADFRAKTLVSFGELPALQPINEGGAYKTGPLLEAKERYKIGRYGLIIPISRVALVNDDLDAFAGMAIGFAQSATRKEADILCNLFAGNPEMDDGNPLFHGSHGNLASSGSDITRESLGAARLAMRTQKGIDGTSFVNITPRYLIVPAAMETKAESMLTELQATKTEDVNPFSRSLELIVEPRLDAYSETAWYLAASPGQIDTIEYSYLEGEEGPRMFTKEGWEVDGMEFKCRLEFGAGAIDWRGFYKNPGA